MWSVQFCTYFFVKGSQKKNKGSMERKKAKMADWWEECFLSGGIGKGRDMAAMSEERDEMWLLCPTVVMAIGWVGDEW